MGVAWLRGPADVVPSRLPGLRGLSPRPQRCIDWNRALLKRELGLTEQDIVDIPQLFSLNGAYAEAFFPDMVRALRGWGSFRPGGAGVLVGGQSGVWGRSLPCPRASAGLTCGGR